MRSNDEITSWLSQPPSREPPTQCDLHLVFEQLPRVIYRSSGVPDPSDPLDGANESREPHEVNSTQEDAKVHVRSVVVLQLRDAAAARLILLHRLHRKYSSYRGEQVRCRAQTQLSCICQAYYSIALAILRPCPIAIGDTTGEVYQPLYASKLLTSARRQPHLCTILGFTSSHQLGRLPPIILSE